MRCLFIWFIILLALACKNERNAPNQLVVTIDRIAIRDAPGEKSRELHSLSAGERVGELGVVSDFVTPLRLGDTLLQAPWIKVRSGDIAAGWIFAGAVRPLEGLPGDWFLQQQMRCFIGPGLTSRRNHWWEQRTQIATEADFARDYRDAMALRDTIFHHLSARAEPNEAGFQPDFFWLKEAMPGFVLQNIGNGAPPYPFIDYRNLWNKALETTGEQDDRFVGICLQIYATDSVESVFPSCMIQTDVMEGSSQLGNGQHLKLLIAISAVIDQGDLFKPELLALKDLILNDILDYHATYWQPAEKIRLELDQVLEVRFSCLTDRDRLALSERRKAFDNPAANGIRVNLRAGE